MVFVLACGGGSAPDVASPAPVAEELPVIAPERHLVLAGAWVQVALGSDGCARASDGGLRLLLGLLVRRRRARAGGVAAYDTRIDV